MADNTGHIIVVQIPDWQKQLIDQRLAAIAQNPERLKPIDELFSELDKED